MPVPGFREHGRRDHEQESAPFHLTLPQRLTRLQSRVKFMLFRSFPLSAALAGALILLAAVPPPAAAQSSSSSSSSAAGPEMPREKAPSLIDPAGPTVSLISSEPLFFMASMLNACGYDEGLADSAPVRAKVREEMNQALAKSEDARNKRDAVCLYVAQHRMTGTELDISQYISLALYLSQPPDLEISVELSEMPPDATQVFDVVPLLKAFAEAVDLHGIWLTLRRSYDDDIAQVHDPLSNMVVSTDLYLKMPAATYSGRHFTVVIEPMLSPKTVNARIYGSDYVVVVSPVNGRIPMSDVRHTYLHYVIEPLLLSRTNALGREEPILKEIRDAPLDFRFRSDTVSLTIECLIKAIEARTMDTGIPAYKIPTNIDRSQLPRYEEMQHEVELKQEAVRRALVQHDMQQGFVLTEYFYDTLVQFEKDPASLTDDIGEMVYSMDVDQQVHRARQTVFDAQSDSAEVLSRTQPRKLEGLDLAESKLENGDIAHAASIARPFLTEQPVGSPQAKADAARANFILARVALLSGQPDEAVSRFQTTATTSREPRLIAWSYIYLGRLSDLECDRDQAVSEYKLALANRDGQIDTRLAAERGVKKPYTVNGHTCEEDDSGDSGGAAGPGSNAAAPSAPAAKPATPQR